MRFIKRTSLWLRALILRGRVERDLNREMAFHVDMETSANIRAGHSPEEARRLATVAFGGRQRFREEAREEFGGRFTEELLQDLRYAVRVLRRSPAFTLTVVLTLALGIGATTVIFSVTDHVVLRSLPYRNADRLVNVRGLSDQLSTVTRTWPANAAHYLAWKQGCTVCDGMIAMRAGERTLTVAGEPIRTGVMRISDDFFTVLGARPEVGRLLTPGDDRPGNERLVVLSDAVWRERYSARRDIVGTTVTLDDLPFVVVGVLAPDFRTPRGSDLGELLSIRNRIDAFVPLALNARERATQGEHDYGVITLLKRGATADQLRLQLDAINADPANLGQLHDKPAGRTAILPLQKQIVGDAQEPLLLLLGAVGAVLLIVCVNLANLLLARSTARRRESAVRIALGAGRGRIVRQALTETLSLALLGGAVGILLSRWGLQLLLAFAPANLPRLSEIRIDARVLGVSLLVSAIVGLAFGLVPALRFGNTPAGDAIKETTRSATDGRRSLRVRALLIGSQVGLSTVLLVGAGLFLQSFMNVMRIDKGFSAERVLALDVALPMTSSFGNREVRAAFFDQALRSVAALPGVTAAGATSQLPVEGESWVDDIRPEGNVATVPRYTANFRFVSPSFFATLDVPIKRGRAFSDADRGRRVIILSERTAQSVWPNENPIGRMIHADNNSDLFSEVVGVAANVRTTGVENEGSLTVYRPYWENGMPFMSILVRTAGNPASIATDARRAIRAVSSSVPISNVRTVAEVVSAAVALRRFELMLIGLFALTALITASIGIYGIISHAMARRSNEIGIRMALGARPIDVHRLVLAEAMRPVGMGILGGAIASVLLGRAVKGLLFQVPSVHPMVLASVVSVLVAIALAACWIPARRAAAAGPGALRID
jgi:predicted permease